MERLSELHELLHDAERHEVIPKLREEIRRKSDDKGCLQALQPDARYRNRRDRHMTGGPGFWSEHFKEYDFLHDKEERPPGAGGGRIRPRI